MIGELAALGAALSWTVSAMLYRKALQETTPVAANILRLSCTSVVLVLFLVGIGKFQVLTSLPVSILVLAGVSGVVGLGLGDTLYMVSLKHIGVARAVPLTCTYPLFSLVWTASLLGAPITLPVVLATIIIVLGIWLVTYEKQTGDAGIGRNVLITGIAAALATAVLWSVSITMMNVAVLEASDLDHALVINTVRAGAVAVFLLALSPLLDRKLVFLKARLRTVAVLLVGGIVALGLGWFLLAYSFTVTIESRAVPISSTTPLFSTLVGLVLLHEKVSWRNALGSAVIVLGVFLIFVFR